MRERQYVVDELTKADTWRMFNIMAEFVEGFDVKLQKCGKDGPAPRKKRLQCHLWRWTGDHGGSQ